MTRSFTQLSRRLPMRVTFLVLAALLIHGTSISCSSGAADQAGISAGNALDDIDTAEVSAGDGPGKAGVVAKGDEFTAAVKATVTTSGNLLLRWLGLTMLEEAYTCSIKLQKVDLEAFELKAAIPGPESACDPLAASNETFYFKVSGLDTGVWYVATLRIIPGGNQNLATEYKILFPPLKDGCQKDGFEVSMIADFITTRSAELFVELLRLSQTGDSNAQITLRNLNLSDVYLFAASAKGTLANTARLYADNFLTLYNEVFAILPAGDYGTKICSALRILTGVDLANSPEQYATVVAAAAATLIIGNPADIATSFVLFKSGASAIYPNYFFGAFQVEDTSTLLKLDFAGSTPTVLQGDVFLNCVYRQKSSLTVTCLGPIPEKDGSQAPGD